MLSNSPKLDQFVYLRLATQPLNVHFDYREPLRPKLKGESKGHVQFTIQIADRTYGPYLTVYRATAKQWQCHQSATYSLETKRIRSRLTDFYTRLFNAWKAYSGTVEPITADMLFRKGAFTVIKLVEGGTVYVL